MAPNTPLLDPVMRALDDAIQNKVSVVLIPIQNQLQKITTENDNFKKQIADMKKEIENVNAVAQTQQEAFNKKITDLEAELKGKDNTIKKQGSEIFSIFDELREIETIIKDHENQILATKTVSGDKVTIRNERRVLQEILMVLEHAHNPTDWKDRAPASQYHTSAFEDQSIHLANLASKSNESLADLLATSRPTESSFNSSQAKRVEDDALQIPEPVVLTGDANGYQDREEDHTSDSGMTDDIDDNAMLDAEVDGHATDIQQSKSVSEGNSLPQPSSLGQRFSTPIPRLSVAPSSPGTVMRGATITPHVTRTQVLETNKAIPFRNAHGTPVRKWDREVHLTEYIQFKRKTGQEISFEDFIRSKRNEFRATEGSRVTRGAGKDINYKQMLPPSLKRTRTRPKTSPSTIEATDTGSIFSYGSKRSKTVDPQTKSNASQNVLPPRTNFKTSAFELLQFYQNVDASRKSSQAQRQTKSSQRPITLGEVDD